MKEFLAGEFDIAVIGAGHAGIEAALAAARLGLRTICFTINLDAVGNMPTRPASSTACLTGERAPRFTASGPRRTGGSTSRL